MMRSFAWASAAIVAAAGLGIYWMANRDLPLSPPTEISQASPTPPKQPVVVSESPTSPPLSPSRPALSEKDDSEPKVPRRAQARITIKPGQPIPELFPYQAERDRLLNLAASQDARNIPVIASSLRHSDTTVREAARQALIQMGDPAAIPHLETAANATKEPTEAELLREAIEFLSLPKFMDVITSSPGVSSRN